jgi:hypothetical protein
MSVPIGCTCGAVRGELDPGAVYAPVVCYCRDCRAFARVLGRPDILDAAGGTDIVTMRPSGLRLLKGRDRVACLSLSPNGPLRWHTACCNTPIGNTARNPAVPYVGIPVAGLGVGEVDIERVFGSRPMVVHAGSATSQVRRTPLRTGIGVARIACGVLMAKLASGRAHPFFKDGHPLAEPRVLTLEERTAASRD